MDAVKLDRPFVHTCAKCGQVCELDRNENPPMATCPSCGDLEKPNFITTCPNCGGTSAELDNGVRMGSSWTGLYGMYDIRCPCGNEEVVFDP